MKNLVFNVGFQTFSCRTIIIKQDWFGSSFVRSFNSYKVHSTKSPNFFRIWIIFSSFRNICHYTQITCCYITRAYEEVYLYILVIHLIQGMDWRKKRKESYTNIYPPPIYTIDPTSTVINSIYKICKYM